MDLWTLLIAAFALWFGYQWGKHHGRNKEEKAKRLLDEAEREKDPEKKTKLLLAWYGLVGNRPARRSFRERLIGKRKRESRR